MKSQKGGLVVMNGCLDYQFKYSQQDIEDLNQIQMQMLNLINTRENWENVSPSVGLEPSFFQKIKDRQNAINAPKSSKELLGINPSSRVAYCPLLLRQLAQGNDSTTHRKKLIPIQQALLEKYSAQWEEKAGANYPFVRLDNEQKVEFAHLVEGLDKEEMSRYIVIDPKDHKMYSHKIAGEDKAWTPPNKKDDIQQNKLSKNTILEK